MRDVPVLDTHLGLFESEIDYMNGTLVGMCESVIEDMIQIYITCELRLAALGSSRHDNILLLFYSRYFIPEPLERKRYAVYTATLYILLPFPQVLDDIIHGQVLVLATTYRNIDILYILGSTSEE